MNNTKTKAALLVTARPNRLCRSNAYLAVKGGSTRPVCVGQPRRCHEKYRKPWMGVMQREEGVFEGIQSLKQPRHHNHQQWLCQRVAVCRFFLMVARYVSRNLVAVAARIALQVAIRRFVVSEHSIRDDQTSSPRVRWPRGVENRQNSAGGGGG